MSESIIDAPESAPVTEGFQAQLFERNILLAAKGGGITFSGKLFTYGSRLVITFFLARHLGAAEYGLYNLTLTTVTIASALAVFGLEDALLRYVPLYARRNDRAGLWGALQIGLGISFLLSLGTGIGLYVFADPIAGQIFHEPQLAPLLRLASLIVPFFALGDVIASATQGFKKMQYATVARDICQPAIRLLLILGLVVVGLDATRAVAVFGFAVAVSFAMLVYFLHKLFSLRRPLASGRRDSRQILRFSTPVYVSGLISIFQGDIQTLLLGTLSTVTSVGIFALARQLTHLGSMFQGAITTASKPILSELFDRGEREQMGRMYQTTAKWMFTVNLPLFLMLSFFRVEILSLFGTSFVGGATALVLMGTAILVDVSTGMCGAVLDMTGHTGLKLFNTAVRLVLSVVLSLLLIPQWGIVGAATAFLITVSTVNLLRLMQVYVLFRLLPYNASFVKPISAGGLALAVTWMLRHWLPAEASFLNTSLHIAMLFAVYVGVISVSGLSPEDRVVLAHFRRRTNAMLSRKRGNDHQSRA